jgi:hypothetical protein
VGHQRVRTRVVAALALSAGFFVNERRARDPLLPLSIFRRRTLRAADLASLTAVAFVGLRAAAP